MTANGLATEDGKVEAMSKFPTPANLAQLQSFLGLVGYYRRFVPGFSEIAMPLTELTQQGVPYSWGELQQAAFELLKQKMCTAPVLAYPDPDKPFVVHSDASDYALGAVLMQDQGDGLRPVAYASFKLKGAEINYAVHEKELLAVVNALRHWRHLLQGRHPFIVHTDHQSLVYLKSQPHLSARQTRWVEFLCDFDFTIQYLPGKSNVVADALSRMPQDLQANVLGSWTVANDLLQRIKTAYQIDPVAQHILQSAEPNLHYVVRDDIILTLHRDRELIYVPDSEKLRQDILYEYHDAPPGGHVGRDKTLDSIMRLFYWPGLHQDVAHYIRTCDSCQRNKPSHTHPHGLLQSLPIPSRPWQCVTLDLIITLPMTARGHDAIVTFVDKFTKMVHFVPTNGKVTAAQLARLFVDNIVRLHGIPEQLISDRDSKFVSKFWQAVFELLGTKLSMSTAYHPQTDGQTERANRVVEEMLRAYLA